MENIVSKLAKQLEIFEYNYKTNILEENVENYFGELKFLTVTGRDIKNKNVSYDFFIKMAPKMSSEIKSLTIAFLFEKEIYFYDKIIPAFINLRSSIDVNEFVPKCFYFDATKNNEIIVLKNLRQDRFLRYDKDIFMDLEHVKIAIEALAKFHSLSMILKQSENNLIAKEKTLGKHYHEYFVEVIKKSMIDNLQIFEGTKYEDYIKNILHNIHKNMIEDVQNTNCTVYGHGDLWRENILFQYENGSPVRACLLDFQRAMLMSPAQDFMTLILANTTSTLRKTEYQNLKQLYHNSLKENLATNHLDCDLIYPVEDFEKDLKITYPACFSLMFLSFYLWLGLQEESEFSIKETLNKEEREEKIIIYKNIIKDLIEDFN